MTNTRIGRLTVTEQVSRCKRYGVGGLSSGKLAVEVRGVQGFGTRAAEVIENLPKFLALKDVEVKIYTPLGHELDPVCLLGKTAEEIDALACEIDKLQVAVDRRSTPVFPQMIRVKGQSFEIMQNELKADEFFNVIDLSPKDFIESAASSKGDILNGNRAKLLGQIEDPSKSGDGLTFLNGRLMLEYIAAANKYGRRFRPMTDAEFDSLPDDLLKELKGTNWFFVETERGSKDYYIRNLDRHRIISESYNSTGVCHYDNCAIRLVEDRE